MQENCIYLLSTLMLNERHGEKLMNAMQQRVFDWMEKHKQSVYTDPDLLDVWTKLQRSSFIQEEASEFTTAARNDDFIEMVDALGDLLVVVYGTACSMGVDLEPVFNEIMLSNETKEGEDASGKVLKGKDYRPPRLTSILGAQGWK